MKYAPYSFSKLSSYIQCQRKFKYIYIDKIIPENKDLTALLKGAAIHSIIESYPNKSNHKLSSKYQYIFDDFINSNLGKKYLFNRCIKELDFGLSKKLEPTTYNDKDALFRGSIDFICTIDNITHLCDWKSGKYKEEKWQSYDQLMFYSIYIFQKYTHIDTIIISYVYVEQQDMENSLILKREYLNVYISQLLQHIKNAENDIKFNKCESSLCNYCEFQIHCSMDK